MSYYTDLFSKSMTFIHQILFKDITSSVAKRVPLIMILWPLPVAILERSKDCHNEGIVRSLQEVIKTLIKGIIPMRGF